MPRLPMRTALTVLTLAIYLCMGAVENSSYQKSVEKWRQDYETKLKGEDDWLSVAGLFWLHEGKNSFGSAAGNDIVLPAPVPAQAGYFELNGGKVTAHVNPGAPITQHGKPVTTVELKPDTPDDRLVAGDASFYVHAGGKRLAIRLKDKNSEARKNFKGLHWFPVHEKYRIAANYTVYPSPQTTQIGIIHGGQTETQFLGYATFMLDGKKFKLDIGEDSPGHLFMVFRDLTSKTETYQAARFLDPPQPKDGKIELDFNKAYNPPCAYNPYTTCPLPSPGNRMQVAIPAGEKRYH